MAALCAGCALAQVFSPWTSADASASTHAKAPAWNADSVPAFGTNSGMAAVTAISRTDAWAAGSSIEHWNGNRWSVVPDASLTGSSPATRFASIAVVPHTSPARLWVVGQYYPSGIRGGAVRSHLAHHTFYSQGLVEEWNGKRWTIIPAPVESNAIFLGVTALSPSDAWLVGQTPSNAQPLVEHWNGAKWHVVSTPSLPYGGILRSVAAVSRTEVWAVGVAEDVHSDDTPLIERGSASSFSLVTAPTEAGPQGLNAVTSVPGGDVWTAGYSALGIQTVPLILRYHGHTWKQIASAPVDGGAVGVAGSGPDDVSIVGYINSETVESAFAEHWNGTHWSQMPVTTPRESPYGFLGVAAVPMHGSRSPTEEAWAVGGTIQRWNGTNWNHVAAPSIGTSATLLSVSVWSHAGKTQAWAVGRDNAGTGLLLHWNGSAWGRIPMPSVIDFSVFLYGVDAVSPSDVWVVGTVLNGGGRVVGLVAHWDGSRWFFLPAPAAQGASELYGVQAFSSSDVWVAGNVEDQQVLAHWDGSSWTSPTCLGGAGETFLTALSGTSDSNVWAAGSEDSVSQSALIAHWDGHTCTDTLVPAGLGEDAFLQSIVAISPNDVWAAGGESGPITSGLIDHYSGGVWTSDAVEAGATFTGISQSTGGRLWVCGNRFNGGSNQPIIERWNGATWTPDSSPGLANDRALWSVAEALPAKRSFAVGEVINPAFGINQPVVLQRNG